MTSWESKISNLKKMKDKPINEKLSYVFTYFKLPIVITLVALVFVSSMIYNSATKKDMALSLCCVNSYAVPGAVQEYLENFAKEIGIDLKKYEVFALEGIYISETDTVTSYQSEQILMVQIASELLDLMVADQNIITGYAYQETFLDLSQVLTTEQLQKYGADLLYMDLAWVEIISNLSFGEALPNLPNPTKPEEMEKPVPIALRIPENSALSQLCYPYGDGVIAVAANTNNTENAVAFLANILE